MKYIASKDCQIVSDALNFSTADCHIIGSCDLYTTKAAGSDKKLYKNIESTLESQHESLVRLSASLSPVQHPVDSKHKRDTPPIQLPQIDLSRNSPFGPLSKISARRTFAYLIATLNASHPDYDFSHILRPSDFRKTSGTTIRKAVDSTMLHLRPRRMTTTAHRTIISSSAPGVPSGEVVWSESMWDLIDREMELRQCEKYVWEPEDDPFEEESSLWSQHYFIFNKEKKRVCYLHYGAFSVISHSPLRTARPSRATSMPRSNVSVGEGAGKRAQYWLGHSVDDQDVDSSWHEDDDYEGEYLDDLDDVREHLEDGYYAYGDDNDDFMDSDDAIDWQSHSKSQPRAHSEGVMEAMEM
ncbi:hypothetical protein CAC42_87 [Sphaceloma murrayae]|uniref:Repressor of RNA polymerase III transcription MAF1 n=1 Tax=Sphaceloma murrayae TaxID=2082308 RepID=A0A2K1QN85_9PEZI|nr:hypothetical protein CAC42_87 [Sphaceloma murrayae]